MGIFINIIYKNNQTIKMSSKQPNFDS